MAEEPSKIESIRKWVVQHKLRTVGCLWVSGIAGSIAYNWAKPNMKTSVKIIHASLNLNPIPMNYINHTIRGTRRRSHRHSLFILSIFLLFLFLRPVTGDADNNGKKESKKEDMREASLVERAIGITGLNSRWDTIRTWAKLAWMNIRPPDSKYGQGSDSSNVVKEAAVRSFETSKEAVQQSAASAAMAAGEAVEKTTEKLRRTLSTERDAKTDL